LAGESRVSISSISHCSKYPWIQRGGAGVGAESAFHAGIDQLLEILFGHFQPFAPVLVVGFGGDLLLELGSFNVLRTAGETDGAKNGSLSIGLGESKIKVEGLAG